MNFRYKGIRIWYLDNPNYRWRYRLFIKLTNFLDGLVAVVSLGMLGTSLEMDVHCLACRDMVKQRKKDRLSNDVMGGKK